MDGLIVVDLPPEEDAELCLPALEAGLNFIRLATPTTDDKRLPKVLESTSGFVYYVSITGITGAALADYSGVAEAVTRIKRHTQLPIAVGFGVKNADNAEAIARTADGVVVGTALVDAIKASLDGDNRATGRTVEAVAALVGEIAQGVRRARAGRERGGGVAFENGVRGACEVVAMNWYSNVVPPEDQGHSQARSAGESLGQMPRQRAIGVPQGHRGQSLCGAGLRLSHALSGRGAARQPVRQRRMRTVADARSAGRSAEIPRHQALRRQAQGIPRQDRPAGRGDAGRRQARGFARHGRACRTSTFMGGSLGMAAGEAIVAGATHALEQRTPFIMFTASGGARMQEGMFSLMQMPRTTIAVRRLREARLPTSSC